jgi:hypothetical protein
MKRLSLQFFFGNEVYYTACASLVIFQNRAVNFIARKLLDWILFSYKSWGSQVGGSGIDTVRVFDLGLSRDQVVLLGPVCAAVQVRFHIETLII